MSSLGFVVLYMLCNTGSSDCVPTSMLLQRFASIEQCHGALPAAEIRSQRATAGTVLTPVCRALDGLCTETAARLDNGRGGWDRPRLRLASTSERKSTNAAIAPHLAIMCRPQRFEPGCDG